jgi:hypothetical protein
MSLLPQWREWCRVRKAQHIARAREAGRAYARDALAKGVSQDELEAQALGTFNTSETQWAFDYGVLDALRNRPTVEALRHRIVYGTLGGDGGHLFADGLLRVLEQEPRT